MAATTQWQVDLGVVIDKSSINEQLKHLAKQQLNVDARLDLTNFTSGMKTMESMISQVANQMADMLDDSTFANIGGEKTVTKWATEYVNAWKKATVQVENDINKTLQSFNNFTFKNAGFENFSAQIKGTTASVESLKTELNNLRFTTDVTGLDETKSKIEILEQEFNKFRKETEQVSTSLNNFSLKNAGFENFSTEINGTEKSVAQLRQELKSLSASGDAAGLSKLKVEAEMMEQEFTKLSKETKQVSASLSDFSFKNARFANFSTEINGSTVSVKGLNEQLKQMATSGNFTGLNDIKNQASMLEKAFTNLCRETDKTSQSLKNFSLNNAGFENFRSQINGIEVSVQELQGKLDSMKVTADFSELDNVKSQLNTLKEEFTQIQKIQINVDTGSYQTQVDSLISKTQQWVDANGNATISTQNLSNALHDLQAASAAYSNDQSAANAERLIVAEKNLQIELQRTKSDIASTNAEFAKTSQVQAQLQRVTEWVDKNGAAMNKWGVELRAMMTELGSGVEIPISRLKELEIEFNQIGVEAREAGNLGASFGQKLQSAFSRFSYWASATMIVMQSIRAIRTAINTVVDLDSALVDLQKTTTMTTEELEDFYYAANDVAIQMGVTTEEIIDQAAAWSRLGYSSQEAATQMAALSSEFASISPGMDTETAQEGLVSVMKANIQMPLYTEMCA